MNILLPELRRLFKGLRYLHSVNGKIYPGKVVHSEREQVAFHIREYLRALGPDKWHLKKPVTHNLIYGKKVTGTASVHLPASLFGVLTVNRNLVPPLEIEYEISEIVAAEFAHTSALELRYELNKLRYINRGLYRDLKNMYLVTESYYARSFMIAVKKNKNLHDLLLAEETLEIDPIVQYILHHGESITVVSNEHYPFAVAGIFIR